MTKIVKVDNFPKHVKLTLVKSFFAGLKTSFIKMNNHGSGTVEFRNEEDALKAIKLNLTEFNKKTIKVGLYCGKEEKTVKIVKPIFEEKDVSNIIEEIMDTGRLFLRNLSFEVTEEMLVNTFKPYGDLVEVSVPFDFINKRPKGFAFVTFVAPEEAVKAYKALNKTKLGDRSLHILPSAEKPDIDKKVDKVPDTKEDDEAKRKRYQEEHKAAIKSSSSSAHNWNTMFVGTDAVAQYLADKLQISKSDLFSGSLKGSMAVNLAKAETQLVLEVRKFLEDSGIQVQELEKIMNRGSKTKGNVNVSFALSSTTFIVKNLTPGVTKDDLQKMFGQFDGLENILLPPYGVTAIITYGMSQQAKTAYLKCAFEPLNDTVLMLQWAPASLFKSTQEKEAEIQKEKKSKKSTEVVASESTVDGTVKKSKKRRQMEEMETKSKKAKTLAAEVEEEERKKKEEEEKEKVEIKEPEQRSKKLIVKNLSFQATKGELEELFGIFHGLIMIRMTKKDDNGHRGFAFLEFETEDDAEKVKDIMGISTHLLGRRLVIEYSHGV